MPTTSRIPPGSLWPGRWSAAGRHGATILAYDAHELINVIALAIRHGITATTLRDEIYTHPSMTEAFNDLFANLA